MATETTDLALPGAAVETAPPLAGPGASGGGGGIFSGVDVLRQVTLIMSLAICLAIAVFIIIWARQPDYRPLAKMPMEEMIEMLDWFDQNEHIDYKLEGQVILVNEAHYQEVKLGMTRAGVSGGGATGNDILMQDMGFGVSQRLEKERLKHAREQQLARTIEELANINRAKVLLAIPKENVFARRSKQPSATVVLTLRKNKSLGGEEIDSIVDVVASSVEGLVPTRVTVTDQKGRLLNSGSQSSEAARARKEFDIVRKREDSYLTKIDEILIPIVGVGNFTAQVDVTMDFSSLEETQKSYNPDLPAKRSEMVVEENSLGEVIAGIPGTLSNQPPVGSDTPQQDGGAANSRQVNPGRTHREQTTNYELDTKISHKSQSAGMMRRLSVSVAVDYKEVVDADGNSTWDPRTREELLNIRRLLQGGLGFNVQRGDTLEVVTVPFAKDRSGEVMEIPLWEQAWFARAIRLVMGGLIIIVLILAIVRPMLRKLIYPDDMSDDLDKEVDSNLDLGDETIELLSQQFDEGQVGFASDGTLMLPDLHQDEDILKAVRALVANEPELSAQVVKGWMMQDE